MPDQYRLANVALEPHLLYLIKGVGSNFEARLKISADIVVAAWWQTGDPRCIAAFTGQIVGLAGYRTQPRRVTGHRTQDTGCSSSLAVTRKMLKIK